MLNWWTSVTRAEQESIVNTMCVVVVISTLFMFAICAGVLFSGSPDIVDQIGRNMESKRERTVQIIQVPIQTEASHLEKSGS